MTTPSKEALAAANAVALATIGLPHGRKERAAVIIDAEFAALRESHAKLREALDELTRFPHSDLCRNRCLAVLATSAGREKP
jgi:hypothetical protein